MRVRTAVWEVTERRVEASRKSDLDRIVEAARIELERLLSVHGTSPWLSESSEVETLEIGASNASHADRAADVGRRLARVIHGGPGP